MRVLLTNHSLQYVGGTEKWIYGMAQELSRLGHEVEVFTFLTGLSSEHIAEHATIVDAVKGREYDVKLINHNTCQAVARAASGYTIYTSHGPRHPLEIPGTGADAYVGVSKEVWAKYAMMGINMEVVTNGIDLEAFAPGRPVVGPPRVLSMCKIGLAGAMVEEACAALGWRCTGVNYLSAPIWDVAPLMREADIVVGCGRTAIEGLASGCQVLVFDARTNRSPRADGWINEQNIEHLRQCNFSTRCYGMEWTVADLKRALVQYPGAAEWQREWAERHADVREKVQTYLELAEVRELTRELVAA